MLRLFRADGSVKQEFPLAVSVQYVGRSARLWTAGVVTGPMQRPPVVVATVSLGEGETIAETFSKQ